MNYNAMGATWIFRISNNRQLIEYLNEYIHKMVFVSSDELVIHYKFITKNQPLDIGARLFLLGYCVCLIVEVIDE